MTAPPVVEPRVPWLSALVVLPILSVPLMLIGFGLVAAVAMAGPVERGAESTAFSAIVVTGGGLVMLSLFAPPALTIRRCRQRGTRWRTSILLATLSTWMVLPPTATSVIVMKVSS